MTPSSKSLSLSRKLAFAAVLTALFLALVLGALEGGLRLAGFGHSPHFARRALLADGTPVYRENRWCTAPFFSPRLVRRPQPMRVPVARAPRTYRVFILGSSAAMGDPEASFSIARVLEKMLPAAYPDIHFEVVNAGITAINSHVVRGIAEDCAALEPDLFVVYEGNNEVIGPFGPSGVFTPFLRTEGAVRAAVAMKGTRTGQWLASLGRAVAGSSASGAPAEWGGMEMFLRQQIAGDDPRLEIVRGHFRANLLAIAAAARRAGAVTVACTVATNQRTFAPFASLHRGGLTADELARWQGHFAKAEAAARAGDLAAAEVAYGAALAIDDRHAELQFRFGRLALQAGREVEAREHLRRALDLDALRFRADSALNEVIRDLSSDRSMPWLRVVDVASALAAASPGGICGDEMLYEHVHLTLRGTYEMARALLPAVGGELVRRGLASGGPGAVMDYDDVRARLGFTAYEQGMIAAEMLARVGRAPFTAQSDHAARLEAWQRRAAAAQAVLELPDADTGLRAACDAAIRAAPDDWILARNTGMMLVARGLPAEGVPYLEKARAWIDDDVDTLAALALGYRGAGRAAEAESVFTRLRELEPRHPAARASD